MIRVLEKCPEEFGTVLRPVNLTGRWKIILVDGFATLVLEKRGVFFKAWIQEDDLMIQEYMEYTNEC